MIDAEPRPHVRAIVASFLFTDLVGFSKGTATEQYAAKAALSSCLRGNLAALRETDYWIKDTGDGALIAFISNPEHALYMALAIAHDYGHTADGMDVRPNGLRTGLHLGTVKEAIDLEARPDYIGDGINATKRIMDFADPGQIAASRNFFDAVANLDTEYAALFRRVGAPDDKHGRAHELYAIVPSPEVLRRLKRDLAAAAPRPAEPSGGATATVGMTQDSLAEVSRVSRTTSNRTPQAVRTRLYIAVGLLAPIVLASAIIVIMRRPGPAAPTVEPVTTRSGSAPVSMKAPAASSSSAAGEPSPPSPAPTAGAPVTGSPSVRTTQVAKDLTSDRLTTPVIVAPASAAKASVAAAPLIPAPPAASARVPVAPERGSPRCSQIVEKAALGEPLSQEEKELANSCR